MNESQFEAFLQEQAREVNIPPETPRDTIWAGIEGQRAGDELARRRRPWLRSWGGWAIGIAALLLIGVGLGRLSMRTPGAPPLASAPDVAGQDLAYRVIADQHLSQAEALLTMVKNPTGADAINQQTVIWARDLLSSTRLLLDSTAADDDRLRILLQDLELVLAEIARLDVDVDMQPRAQEELELVQESIENGSVLPRLRTARPAGAPTAAS